MRFNAHSISNTAYEVLITLYYLEFVQKQEVQKQAYANHIPGAKCNGTQCTQFYGFTQFYTKEVIRHVHIDNKFKLGFSLNSEDLMKLNSSSLTTNSSSVGFETFISKIRRGDVLHFVMKNNNTNNIEYFDCELELHQF